MSSRSGRAFGELPPALFSIGRVRLKALPADDVEDVMQPLRALMVRLAADTRESKTRRALYRHGACPVFGESVDGPLLRPRRARGRNARLRRREAHPALCAGDGRRCPVAEASEHLSCSAPRDDRIVWATMNAGEVHQQRGKRPVSESLPASASPVELTVSGENTADLA